jgi:3'-phosphoadenosine 5'-phosphosulfate sulfotransferase (PAPS reductase)/FAD synthetase
VDIWDSEQVVEDMLAKADAVMADVFREFHISHVIAAYSGGDDSIVSTHWAMNKFSDCLAMIADTQIGLERTRQHQNDVMRSFGWNHARLSASVEGPPSGWEGEWIEGSTPYEESVFNHGFPGHAMHGRMYQRLKQRAFRKVKPILGKRPRKSRILVISGIRQDESAIRAGYKRAYAEEPSECFVWANPFYYCTAGDFEAYRQEFGLPRNPVKSAVGISGECECGAHAAEGERDAIRVIEPEFEQYLQQLESVVKQRFPWGWDESPPESWVAETRARKRLEEDRKYGQCHLFGEEDQPTFMPACVGCNRKQLRKR